MNLKTDRLAELKAASKEWEAKIDDLKAKLENVDDGQKGNAWEVFNRLQQRKLVMDQYLAKIEAESGGSPEHGAADLDAMFQDVDDSYREALYFLY